MFTLKIIDSVNAFVGLLGFVEDGDQVAEHIAQLYRARDANVNVFQVVPPVAGDQGYPVGDEVGGEDKGEPVDAEDAEVGERDEEAPHKIVLQVLPLHRFQNIKKLIYLEDLQIKGLY